jgi:hypothetical protein
MPHRNDGPRRRVNGVSRVDVPRDVRVVGVHDTNVTEGSGESHWSCDIISSVLSGSFGSPGCQDAGSARFRSRLRTRHAARFFRPEVGHLERRAGRRLLVRLCGLTPVRNAAGSDPGAPTNHVVGRAPTMRRLVRRAVAVPLRSPLHGCPLARQGRAPPLTIRTFLRREHTVWLLGVALARLASRSSRSRPGTQGGSPPCAEARSIL